MENNNLALHLKDVTMGYGPGKGVFDINLDIKKGQTFGLLGPSGAGKTTLLRIVLGFIKAKKGTVQVFGQNVWNHTQITNASIAYIPGEPVIPNTGTGLGYLKFYARLRGIKDLSKMNELLKYFDMEDNIKTNLKEMSKGQKQRVAIISAFMGDYDVYYFDEPTSGLDPVMREKFIRTMIDLKKHGKTVFISSHMMDEIERTVDELVILKKGEIKFRGTIKEITDAGKTVNDVFWDVYRDIKSFEEEMGDDNE